MAILSSRRAIIRAAVSAAHVFSTLDPANKGAAITLSLGNLKAASTAAGLARSTSTKAAGKVYFEVTVGTAAAGGRTHIGVVNSAANLADEPGFDANGWSYGGAGVFDTNSVTSGTPATYTTADVINVAVDAGIGSIWFGKNGVFNGSPSAGSGAAFTGMTGPFYASIGWSTGINDSTINFGASAFVSTPPTGFSAWG